MYLKLIRNKQDLIKAAQPNHNAFTKSNKVDGRPWNVVTAHNVKPVCPQTENIGTHDQATADMLNILMTLKSIKSQFLACNNMMDKVILILTKLGQYV